MAVADLTGFFQGLKVGADIYGGAEDDAVRRAKEKLILQGLNDDYADEQVLRADALRNAKSQYDFDTANRSANLDTLYRTHDGFVDATVAQNQFANDNYTNQIEGLALWGNNLNRAKNSGYIFDNANNQNQIEGLSQWGQLKNDALGKTYERTVASEQEVIDDIALLSEPERQLALAKANLSTGRTGVAQDILDGTRGTQVSTGILNAGVDNLVAQDKQYDAQGQLIINPIERKTIVTNAGTNQLVAEDKQYDAQGQLIINPTERQTIVNNAGTNLTTSRVNNQSATANEGTDIATNIVRSQTGLTKAQTDNFNAGQTQALTTLSASVKGMPEESRVSYLESVLIDPNATSDEKSVARQMVTGIREGKREQREAILLRTNPLHYLLEKGVNVEANGTERGGIVNGTNFSDEGLAILARGIAGQNSAPQGMTPQQEIDYKANSKIREAKLTQLAQLASKLSEDGITGEDYYNSINQYIDVLGLSSEVGKFDPATGVALPPVSQQSSTGMSVEDTELLSRVQARNPDLPIADAVSREQALYGRLNEMIAGFKATGDGIDTDEAKQIESYMADSGLDKIMEQEQKTLQLQQPTGGAQSFTRSPSVTEANQLREEAINRGLITERKTADGVAVWVDASGEPVTVNRLRQIIDEAPAQQPQDNTNDETWLGALKNVFTLGVD